MDLISKYSNNLICIKFNINLEYLFFCFVNNCCLHKLYHIVRKNERENDRRKERKKEKKRKKINNKKSFQSNFDHQIL